MTHPQSVLALASVRRWVERSGFHARDWGLLAAALGRPWATFGAEELYADPYRKAAAVIDSIESSRPLLDGNKRLGVLMGSLMLRLFGLDDLAIDDDAWFDLILDVANNHPDVDSLAERLRSLVER